MIPWPLPPNVSSHPVPDWMKNLPPFEIPVCRKCAFPEMTVSYHAPILDTDWPEHLFWKCKQCGAGYYTKCKDAA